jgi:hypothetical protein
MVIQNTNHDQYSAVVYLDAALTKGPITLPYNESLAIQWTNGVWATIPNPPVPLRVNQ